LTVLYVLPKNTCQGLATPPCYSISYYGTRVNFLSLNDVSKRKFSSCVSRLNPVQNNTFFMNCNEKIPSSLLYVRSLEHTIAVNFVNILQVRFSKKFWRQKSQSQTYLEINCSISFHTKNARLKCWWNWLLERSSVRIQCELRVSSFDATLKAHRLSKERF